MALNLGKSVVDYLTAHPDEKFSARQIAEWQGACDDDEEPEEGTYDRFIRNGQYPVR